MALRAAVSATRSVRVRLYYGERIKDDPRFPFGLPKPDNANYLWIQLFYSALDDSGRAGFVMANSASDARGSEQLIRERLLREGAVDVMISISPNFFYTV